ncbi:unnamed protein product [Miscanthus lutarioriparius]|uniref:non-specific serine/threonine protein kinase n=1 Tax=Miscanthus lutarioriparius TaxID=422564 RepID=A0A811QB11_9POAL|nr:unnamed protein product [Miscanthus lutarioriparius]
MADPVASVEKIVKIGLRIKEAVDTVRRNEEVCREIRQRVLRFSAILSQLHRTGMLNDDNPAMSGALEDLEQTLGRALDLVAACQGRGRSAVHRLITAGSLSRKLREVKDDISNKVMLASFAINANTTIMLLTLHFGGAYPRPQPLEDAGGLIQISHNSDSAEDARSEQNGEENNVLGEGEALLAPLVAITFREFKFSELTAATNGFLDSNIVGRGGIATVYKGVLNDGSVIAIKKFRWAPRLGWAYTYEQLLLASKLQHKNIIKVLGYAHEVGPVVKWMKGRKGPKRETEYIWVEEYAQKGTLHDIIHSQEHRLDWSSLIQIIEGIAQGVNYLHEQHIVHLDLKPTNIVMDVHMNPKITDFEVAKVLSANQMRRDIITAGTFQYIAPEYLTDGVVSTMNDVYAFGITVLETVSGIRRRSSQPREFQLHQWAWKALEGRRKEFDPLLFGESQLVEIKRCIKLGLLCAQHEWRDRPTMADVLLMLNGEKRVLTPKKPAYIKSNA